MIVLTRFAGDRTTELATHFPPTFIVEFGRTLWNLNGLHAVY